MSEKALYNVELRTRFGRSEVDHETTKKITLGQAIEKWALHLSAWDVERIQTLPPHKHTRVEITETQALIFVRL